MKIFGKKLSIPADNSMREVDVVQLWYVEWTSRTGSFHGCTKTEYDAFPVEADAHAFAESLRAAFKLTRNKSDETKVRVYPKDT